MYTPASPSTLRRILNPVRPLLASALLATLTVSLGGLVATAHGDSPATAQDRTPPARPATPKAPPAATPPANPAGTPAATPSNEPPPSLSNRGAPEKKPEGETKHEGSDAAKSAGAPLEYVQMSTTMGTVILELNRDKAPLSVENFLKYVDKGFYDGTIFHRIIKTFVIQGGGFTADMTQKDTDPPIKNECTNGLKNVRGSLSMARTQDPDSATSQFFINVVDNIDGQPQNLDNPINGGPGYAVFGRIYAGMAVVDTIKDVPVGTVRVDTPRGQMPMSNVPKQAVMVIKMSRITEAEAKKAAEAANQTPAAAPAAAPAVPAAVPTTAPATPAAPAAPVKLPPVPAQPTR